MKSNPNAPVIGRAPRWDLGRPERTLRSPSTACGRTSPPSWGSLSELRKAVKIALLRYTPATTRPACARATARTPSGPPPPPPGDSRSPPSCGRLNAQGDGLHRRHPGEARRLRILQTQLLTIPRPDVTPALGGRRWTRLERSSGGRYAASIGRTGRSSTDVSYSTGPS